MKFQGFIFSRFKVIAISASGCRKRVNFAQKKKTKNQRTSDPKPHESPNKRYELW